MTPASLDSPLARAAETLRQAGSVAVLTGAGVSAESGIPTYRDPDTGLWSRLHPLDLASPAGYRRDPAEGWAWYRGRRDAVLATGPNAGHRALAEMERRVPAFTLLTQNIDGLHQAAGSRRVVELHGSLHRVRCLEEDRLLDGWAWDRAGSADADRCPRCGGPLRPDVVWFGESLPRAALQAAFGAVGGCDLFLSVGTSGQVEPAASFAYAVLERGRPVIEVNPEPTALGREATYCLRGPAGAVLPRLVALAWAERAGAGAR